MVDKFDGCVSVDARRACANYADRNMRHLLIIGPQCSSSISLANQGPLSQSNLFWFIRNIHDVMRIY